MDMRVHLTDEQFASLSGFALGQELIQPAIRQARGQRLETKKRVYDGQFLPMIKAGIRYTIKSAGDD